MSHPDVSIIIAAYNAGHWLERAVASGLAQTGVTVEVIVINDCSSDDTLARAQALASADSRVKVLENPVNSGPSVARNRGMAAATGTWCAVLDADDAFTPERLETLIAAAKEHQVDLIGDLPVYYDLGADQAEPNQPTASGTVSHLGVMDFLEPDAESGVDLGLMQPVLRRKLVTDGLWHYPETTRHGEDFDLCVTALRQGVTMALLRRQMYLYSTRFGAITQAFSTASVTSVNYHKVADGAERLLADMRSAGDLTPELEERLQTRILRARTNNKVYGWSTLRRGAFRRWWRWLRDDPRNRADMAAVLRQKLLLKRGLPE